MAKKQQPTRHQEPVSFRLSHEGIALLEALSDALGINKTAVIEQALRLIARREGVKAEGPRPDKA